LRRRVAAFELEKSALEARVAKAAQAETRSEEAVREMRAELDEERARLRARGRRRYKTTWLGARDVERDAAAT